MAPEISHRCSACGVSIRDAGERILFCPECGKPLAAPTTAEKAEAQDASAGSSVDTSAVSAAAAATGDRVEPTAAATATPAAGQTPRAHDERATARERTRETLQRASKMTRGAIEDNVKRVEKIHHVSSVMLEEATYDPSLRFVLVALGLFVLSIILLVLSKVMG